MNIAARNRKHGRSTVLGKVQFLVLRHKAQKGYEGHRGLAVLQLVDGQDAVDHQLCLAVDE